jgi:hypothetical protein
LESVTPRPGRVERPGFYLSIDARVGAAAANDRQTGKKRDLSAIDGILCNFPDIV